MKYKQFATLAYLSAASAAMAFAMPAWAQDDKEKESNSGIAEIVVTAQKREENVQSSH
jgi:outer membrane cobalamin receptor